MDYQKNLLLRSAARLYSIGVDLDSTKETIRQLAKADVGYEAPEMVRAVSEYIALKQQWEALEQEYQKLKKEILGS